MAFTVNKIAQLAGVTIRTLRYYDKIGLLVPSARSEAGYRLYSREDILSLQQILFYRELDFPLSEIGKLLKNPAYDREAALKMQYISLEGKARHYHRLAELARNTLNSLEGEWIMKDQELLDGFSYDAMMAHQKQYEKEVENRWGNTEAYKQSRERTAAMSKADWEHLGRQQERGLEKLVALYKEGAAFQDPRVQALVKEAHELIDTRFYTCSTEMFANLGEMYVTDSRFTAYYDKHAEGLAAFYNEAIQYYCRTKK